MGTSILLIADKNKSEEVENIKKLFKNYYGTRSCRVSPGLPIIYITEAINKTDLDEITKDATKDVYLVILESEDEFFLNKAYKIKELCMD